MNPSSAGRLLLVADHGPSVALVQRVLAGTLRDCAVTHVDSVDDIRDAVILGAYDCVAIDASLLHELLDDSSDVPIVALTDSSHDPLELIRRGAFDALTSGDSELHAARAIGQAIEVGRARRAVADAELRSQRRRDLAPIGHFELDADFMPIYVNDACQALTGLVQDDPDSFRRSLREIHPDDLATVYAAVTRLRAGETIQTEHRRVDADGEVVCVIDTRIARVEAADGRIVGYVGGAKDVTQQRAVEERERTSRAQLEALIEHSPSAMWFKDNDVRYVFVNPQYARSFGHAPEFFVGKSDEDIHGPEFAAFLAQRDQQVLDSGGPVEFDGEMMTPRGMLRYASVVFPVFDDDGAIMGTCGIAEDVTRRREIENRFRRSFDDAPVGMSLTRPDGTWLNVNRALAELLGYERAELLDRSHRDFTHPDDVEDDARRLTELMRTGGTLTREKRLVRRDGTVIWVLSCVDIARDASGRPLWALTHVLDITQRKRAEHELQRQQVDMLTIARVARDTGSSERPGLEVCEAAGQITGASWVGLLELRGTDRLALTAATGANAPLGREIRFEDRPTGAELCAASRERLVLEDEPDALSPRLIGGVEFRTVVFEPILRGTDVLGVLAIAWALKHDPLTPRESSVIRLLAAEMASIIERAQLTAQLRELARTDPLTGLANRRVWDERIGVELNHARRFGNPLCVALVDLDHFKPYNDTYGHQAGDRLLTGATAAWVAELRGGDLMARVGGDEFAVLLPDCDLEGGQALVERLRQATPSGVGCSVGIVQWDGHESSDEAVARADAALYAAKEAGRARSVAG